MPKRVKTPFRGAPSTYDEVQELILFDGLDKDAPYSIPCGFDKEGEPWCFRNGEWQRTVDIGDPNAVLGEQPKWKFDVETTHA
jgi:hypothetical protein